MILRRLSHSLKAQNWIAIGIEFVLLVVGVYLGIQVSNWNALQQDHRREVEYIERLQRDFNAIDARLVDNIARWEVKASSSVRVLADFNVYRQSARWPRSKSEMLSDLNNTFNARIPAPRSATYVELLSAGQLGLIRNTKLRDALLEYDAQVGYSMTAFDVLVKRVEPSMASVVAYLEYDQTKTIDDISTEINVTEQVWTDADLERMVDDPAVATAIKMYAAASRNQLFVARLQRNKAKAVMSVLDKSPNISVTPP